MIKILSSNNKPTIRYVDDIKSLLIANRRFSYSKNSKIKNNQVNNVLFYNKKIVNNSLKLYDKKLIKTTTQNDIFNISFIESMLFNNISFEQLHFHNRDDKHLTPTTPKNTINFIKESYIFYFTAPSDHYLLNFQKVNDGVLSIKLNSDKDIGSFDYDNIVNNFFEVKQAVKNGSDLLMIERDYFNFNPCYELGKLDKNYKHYFNIFECSYFYYLNSSSMQIITQYYSKLNELLSLFNKDKNNIKMIENLQILNDNTLILLKQNKLL